jgi:peptidoglycan/LPS O-acetylase OafA/YrhL
MNKKSQRYFGLDVLRTLSAYAVVGAHLGFFLELFHRNPNSTLFFIPGELGLDAFFVMSGFLIGTILLRIFR